MRAALLIASAACVTAVSATAARAQNAPPASATAGHATPTAAAATAPDVGQPAPDFTLAWADASGPRATPFTLSSLRGKVVVLAFYPKDRTGGCTAELTKFRDEYTSLFGSKAGSDVVVVPISADGLTSHANWAKESNYPFALVSDTTFTAMTAYGSRMGDMPMSRRTVFVIGRDGTVQYRDLRFEALSEGAYDSLKQAVSKAKG